MIQANNTIKFCTIPLLIKSGFTRSDAYSIMTNMKNDYISKGYYSPNEKKNKLPLEYVNKWLNENMATSMAITC